MFIGSSGPLVEVKAVSGRCAEYMWKVKSHFRSQQAKQRITLSVCLGVRLLASPGMAEVLNYFCLDPKSKQMYRKLNTQQK